MRTWAQRGVCAWGVVFALGCASEAPPGAPPPPVERSLTLRAEVKDAQSEPAAAAPEPSDAACGPTERGLEPFDAGVPSTRAALLVQHGERRLGLPLQSASYDSFVVGTVAETLVKQRYFNPLAHTIEAVYVFPLPHDGAVFDYSIQVQDRRVHGVMKRRAEARALYDQAKANGHTAGLLEQERPNVFTQSIANIPPGEAIEVELRVVQSLERENGRYELVLPTVVGPRYVPGTATSSIPAGSFAPDTDRVPDGSRITPMPQLDGTPPRPNLSIRVAIESGMHVGDLRSTHHDVDLHDEDGVAHVTLSAGATVANRDFVLSWSEGAEHARATLMVQPEPAPAPEPAPDQSGGYFTLTLEPPRAVPAEVAVPRELVFVVDASGSMSGAPIETAKDAVRKVLRRLAPSDVFQIVQFSQTASSLGSAFLPNTPQAVKRGLAFIDAMQGEGGTEMLAGVRTALELPRDPRRVRMVLFLTDGYIGNESAIFRAVRERIGDARLFSLGVGTAVNRHLLDGLSRMGRGSVAYVSADEKPDAVVERFFERIDRPAWTDVAIDWGGLEVEDVEPRRLPDLFAGRPVVVFGRYRGEPRGEITLHGRRAGGVERVPVAVDFRRPSASSAALSAMWARSRIARLSDEALELPAGESSASLEEAITGLALRHHVMTEFTAFVAVDDARVVQPGTQTLHVPVALPSGVSAKGVFGHAVGLGVQGAIGLGQLGTIGHGAGGAALGYRHRSGDFHGRDAAVPRIRIETLDVRGSLSKELVRRMIQRHVNEVRFCHEQELNRQPDLRGRVQVKLVISPTGSVTAAGLVSSTLGNAKVESCLLGAVRRWTFPRPDDGGIVVVTVPFVLELAGQSVR